jgi:hypothetical protein
LFFFENQRFSKKIKTNPFFSSSRVELSNNVKAGFYSVLCIKPYALFLTTLERRAAKAFLRGESVFEDKNRRFLSSKTPSPQ